MNVGEMLMLLFCPLGMKGKPSLQKEDFRRSVLIPFIGFASCCYAWWEGKNVDQFNIAL
jgi:hypothetical protein